MQKGFGSSPKKKPLKDSRYLKFYNDEKYAADLLRNKKTKEAKNLYLKLLKSEYESYEIFFNLGFIEINQKNYREAIKDCSEFIKRDRNSIAITRIYELRAKSKSKIGDYYGAISDFGEIIKREPRDAEVYIMRALLKINQVNQIKSGCKDLKKAVSLGYPANKGVKKYCN